MGDFSFGIFELLCLVVVALVVLAVFLIFEARGRR